MARSLINWHEKTPLNGANLDSMEDIYEEIITDIAAEKGDGSMPLVLQSGFATPTGATGRLFINRTLKVALYYTGSAWTVCGKLGDSGL